MAIDKYIYKVYQYLRFIKYSYPVKPQVIFKLLLESQYWANEKVFDFQLNKINILLQTAKNSSIYYKNILKEIELPLKEIDEFKIRIPFITKEIIKNQFEQLKTDYYCDKFKQSTSGSSGEPITVYISGMDEVYRKAGFLRFLDWWHIKPYDKQLFIWGRIASNKSNNTFDNIINKIKARFRLRYDINVFDLNTESIVKYYKDLKKFKPVYIYGYKSAILQFAELLEYNGLYFDNFKFKVAVVTSEILLEEERHYIEKILKCKVANEYGASEVGKIAQECPNGSMHIFEESVLLNTNINNDVSVTAFHNDSMPLINYQNNDKVIISDSKCVCGRNSRIISHIEGRVDDYIIKPDGNKISQYLFYYTIKELDDVGLDNCVLKYKLIQNKNKFQILIVPSKKYNGKVEDYIKTRLYEKIGKEISIEFSLVDSIPRDKSGKLRFFVRID